MVASPATVELAVPAADRPALESLAALAGGVVAGPFDAARVLESLGPPTRVVTTPARITLWNTWPLLTLLVATLATEWGLRKRMGLI